MTAGDAADDGRWQRAWRARGDELVVYEQEFSLRVGEECGHVSSIQASVYGVEHCTSHGHCKVHLVHGGDIRGEHGNNIVLCDAQRSERRSQTKATLVSLAPCEVCGLVDDGGAVRIHHGSSLQERHRTQWSVVCCTLG